MPRTSVKGQILVDLVAEFAKAPLESEIEAQHVDGKSVGSIALRTVPLEGICRWSSKPKGIRSGASTGLT